MDAHQTSIYTAILISSTILGIIILFFIVSIIRQQRRAYRFYKLAINAEIDTLEKERSRMAADLHDELGPVLSAIKFKVGSLDLQPGDEKTADGIYEDIDGLVKRMRDISNDLMPNVLLHKGVVMAITEFIEDTAKRAPLSIDFQHQAIPDLPQFESIHLYRIILEIIHNSIKHSGATTLKIVLKKHAGLLLLESSDNGKGFDYHTVTRETNRQGLRNLLNRADMIGANFFVETGRGKGTVYSLEMPLNTHQDE